MGAWRFAVLGGLWWASTGLAAACELRVRTPSLESYSHVSAEGQRGGYAVDLVRERGWQMVDAGRLDAIFADEASALRHGFRPGGGGRIEPLVHLTPVPFHIAASRRTVDATTFERFDSALEAMSRDGTLVRLKERHVPCRISPQTLSCLGPLATAVP